MFLLMSLETNIENSELRILEFSIKSKNSSSDSKFVVLTLNSSFFGVVIQLSIFMYNFFILQVFFIKSLATCSISPPLINCGV
jgi:hypothetical protein